MLTPELSQRQEAKQPGKTSELSQRQEAEPPGKTSELSQGRRQNHQERPQSYAKTKGVDIKSSMSNKHTNIKSSKSSPKVLLSHCSRVDIKRRMRNTNIKSSKFIKIITKVLLSHCSRVNIKRRIRNTQTSPQVLLSHCSQINMKRRIRNTQTSNHHQRSCCHIAAGSTSKEG